MKSIGVLDYGAGNLRSVETALNYLGVSYICSSSEKELSRCEKLIFPGVGEAQSAMKKLTSSSLDRFLQKWIEQRDPILGICVGCQLLFESSEERETTCLRALPGMVRLFPSGVVDSAGFLCKIPHIGWNQVEQVGEGRHPLFRDVPQGSSFYFVHSYYVEPTDPDCIIAETSYTHRFASVVAKDNVMAVQFHPEKSGEPGLTMLRNFVEL